MHQGQAEVVADLLDDIAVTYDASGKPTEGPIPEELVNEEHVVHDALIEGIVVVFALVTVAGNLLADLLYTVLDPRIRYGRAAS